MTSDKNTEGIFLKRISVVLQILKEYDGSFPLQRFLKGYYARHRNFGSSDRRLYSSFVYSWFRLGRCLEQSESELRLTVAAWLTHSEMSPLLQFMVDRYAPELNHTELSTAVSDKFAAIQKLFPDAAVRDLAPAGDHFSSGISEEQAGWHQLMQPLTWVRVRNRRFFEEDAANNQLQPVLHDERTGAVGFSPAAKLTDLRSYAEGAFEIQDLSSQLAGMQIPAASGEHWWDCCCGAGGKSLQLSDRVPGIHLTCTDVRNAILENLKERLRRNRIRTVDCIETVDLLNPSDTLFSGKQFDGIIADVPCSGSGTWARSPEMIRYFDPHTLPAFQQRQLKLLRAVWPYLKPGGTLVYLTCSLYRSENEDVVNIFSAETDCKPLGSELVSGFGKRADHLFVSLIQKG